MKYLLALLLTGCTTLATTIDTSRAPPNDWPQLKVVVVKTDSAEVQRQCYATTAFVVAGCTTANFLKATCYIYLSTDNAAVIEHEKMHCLGYDHPGESTMRDWWEKWKRSRA